LHADVAEAELGIEEIEIEDALGPLREGQSWSALAVEEFDGTAGLLAAEDADEALAEPTFADLLLDEFFLAVIPLQVAVRSTFLSGEVFGVGDESIGFVLYEGEEIFTLDAERMIDEAIKVGVVGEREVPLEDHAIVAAENGDDGGSELDEESVRLSHGVLLQRGMSATPF
jgi:hypothetical protein